jgi:uncharacterized protein YjiS (DUF1127 family)
MIRVAQFGALVRMWRRRVRERRLAAQFSDRDLWDVGLTRGDIYREFSRPFWRADAVDGSVRLSPIGAMTCSRPMKAAATAAR